MNSNKFSQLNNTTTECIHLYYSPVKIRDHIFFIRENRLVVEAEVSSITFVTETSWRIECIVYGCFNEYDWCRNVFPTKEMAEKRLEEIKNEKGISNQKLCPVKPGQTVYVVAFGEIHEIEIAEVRITKCGWYAVDTDWCGRYGLVALPDTWLDTVFPTRTEAEASLRRKKRWQKRNHTTIIGIGK